MTGAAFGVTANYINRQGRIRDLEKSSQIAMGTLGLTSIAVGGLSLFKRNVTMVDGANSGTPMSAGEALRAKWGHLSTEERQALIQSKAESNAERWVSEYESGLNQQYPGLDAHFADKHGPDIPLTPNLEQRSVNGSHPRTGAQVGRTPRAQTSSQFNDWRTQMAVINEATTRVERGLPRYNGFDAQNNPVVTGRNSYGVGRGFTPNKQNLSAPIFNPKLDGWIIRFDGAKDVPFTGYPTK